MPQDAVSACDWFKTCKTVFNQVDVLEWHSSVSLSLHENELHPTKEKTLNFNQKNVESQHGTMEHRKLKRSSSLNPSNLPLLSNYSI